VWLYHFWSSAQIAGSDTYICRTLVTG
jgi:hypothetical protein